MKEQLEQIKANALTALEAAATPAALEELRVKLLGKKGELTAVLKQMGKLPLRSAPSWVSWRIPSGQASSRSWKSGRPTSTPPRWKPSWLPKPST